ncbi:Asparagine synthetase domain-containing protein 1 [Geodia barretti]|nr:Asparagine synthetase domain-containing protein 1 [Geodia barretti]
MRGELTPLPLGNEAGDWLLWNGNVFGGDIQIAPGENDTVKVLQELSSKHTHSELLETLASIHGPWSFVFWQASSQSLWFGRDVFGRRSLVWHLPHSPDDSLVLSSVGHFDHTTTTPDYWLEVPAVGIYRLSCTGIATMESAALECYLWKQGESTFQSEQVIADELGSLKTCLTVTSIKEDHPLVYFPSINSTKDVDPPPHPLADSSHPQEDTRAAEAVSTTDSQSSTDPPLLPSERVGPRCARQPPATTISYGEHVERFLDILQAAVQRRVSRAPPVSWGKRQVTKVKGSVKLGDDARTEGGTSGLGVDREGVLEGHARVAVLFSGGVDSAVLAAIVDRCLDPEEEIDLINVAFEQKHLPDLTPPGLMFLTGSPVWPAYKN